ncbi:iron-containing alcohol dehydrogenase [Pelagibacterales bacterium SAG-MED17]|nr:iron-containing alcohol dehydrogenase [Pelagibacterales bacterium SAG-MED23]MBD1158450.1 iron-containing alcohol dehydrogenase [Pelagibacterales bacterium SAG-MED17]
MTNYNWNYPTTVWVGNNRIKDLEKACIEIKTTKPLLVTDRDLINLEFLKDLINDLEKRFQLYIFSNFSGNPTGENVDEGVEVFNKNNCDSVIAIGGGSALDVGKAIAFMSAQSRPIWDFEDIGDYWKRADEKNIAPIIAIPTTAGTGSETGRASAIINSKTGIKKIIFHPKFLPSIVILDPVLTKDLSPRLTGATGMDALAHNLEAFCAPGFHPMADGIAIEGMRLIKKSLLKAVKNGSDMEARADLLAAASMGSTAFQKGLGAIHSLSHPLNAQFNLHHGLSNAIFMPYVLTFNKENIEERIISICDYLSLNKSFDTFLNWILDLRNELNIPHKLSDIIEIKKMNLDELSKMALEDPSTSSNPKKLTLNDMKVMYEHSISGELF